MRFLPEEFMGYNVEPTDIKQFTELCYMLGRLGQVQIKTIQGYEYPKNYYSATFIEKGSSCSIFMNCYSPLVAFGVIRERGILFEQNATLESLIAHHYPYIKVLTPKELAVGIQPSHLSAFSPKGRAAIEY
ncbi:hypothetical protein N474_15095 [Pseudoalteromonas luteoviolacea CPMOR-2]|uniref:hypothetical protein n=1 Tax=Pseudoalteromonas luteoviolacea TaxID=43657 RepID=UPI0007B06D80|nr:hypothetical protein [Pseudoalteromonas luteoviolacea]KZN55310.1 hypothetical protein N474_15095 [Pseudoalteromonas luteoviolacea CPMOR-2]